MVRILLAGPDNYRWNAYAEHLQADGYAVSQATGGVECIELLSQLHPHVLVLEPTIPWGGGDGILEIRDSEPSLSVTRVILLTSGCDSSLLYRLSQYSVDDLLWQPVPPAVLGHRIHQLLGRHANTVAPT